MSRRDRQLATVMLVPAVLLLAAASLAGGAPELRPLPEPPDEAGADHIAVEELPRLPEEAPREIFLSRRAPDQEALVHQLRLDRELVIRVTPETPWAEVRPALLATMNPAARVERVSLAEGAGERFPIEVPKDWWPGPDGKRTWRVEEVPTLQLELKRGWRETVTRFKLLDSELGADDQALRVLADCLRRIRAHPDNRGLPAQIFAWGRVPAAQVFEVMRVFRAAGYPRIRLSCLRPRWEPGGHNSENLTFVDTREEAARLTGQDRLAYVMECLWAGPEHVATYRIALVLEFGEAALPGLFKGLESPDAKTRRIALQVLGCYRPYRADVEESVRRVVYRDPDREVQREAEAALEDLLSAR